MRRQARVEPSAVRPLRPSACRGAVLPPRRVVFRDDRTLYGTALLTSGEVRTIREWQAGGSLSPGVVVPHTLVWHMG